MIRNLLFLACLALVMGACGTSGPSTEFDVTLTDFQFVPNSFAVPAGEEITLNISNSGAVVHNFVIMNYGTSAGDSFDEEDVSNVYWEVELAPGGKTNVTFTAPTEPGEYQVICRTQGHIMSGMIAKLTVVTGE